MVINMMDEIDGSQADEAVRFGLDGEAFELRSKAHAEELRRSLEPYVKTAKEMVGALTPLQSIRLKPGRSERGHETRHEGIG
jgi:hypothetical protein